jgi:transcriptional regulator with XRE-family HTH domain
VSGSQRPHRTLAEKINWLFETLYPPDWGPWSNQEVERWLADRAAVDGDGLTISANYLLLLRNGQRDNPTMRNIQALAKFFQVDPGYFLRDDTDTEQTYTDLQLLGAIRDNDLVKSIALRAFDLDPEMREWLAQSYTINSLPRGRSGRQRNSPAQTTLPITIYLSDESVHEQVEAAVEDLLAASGVHVEHRDDPVFGSWFRRMRARTGQAVHSPLAREAAIVAAHAAESRLVHAQDATVTETMLRNLGPVLTALHPTKDAVIRAGALLIVKVDWIVAVHQLTPAQQLRLDHQPQLAQSPHDILSALDRRTGNSTPSVEAVDGACGSSTAGRTRVPASPSPPDPDDQTGMSV